MTLTLRAVLTGVLALAGSGVALGLLACRDGSPGTRAAAAPATAVDTVPFTPPRAAHDWPRFGFDVAGSGVSTAPAGIDAATLSSLERQQVRLDGTVDASPIYLSGVLVNGGTHDVFFVTTTYGKTIAVDADDGAVLWEYTPPDYASWAGSYRITTATPVADPDRMALYAAAPDGRIRKLSVADGSELWYTAITKLPQREKIAASLNFYGGRVIAATGGYVGDQPPYQGHVAVLDGVTGRPIHVWNALCSDRSGLFDPTSCPQSGAAIWGRAGAVVDTAGGAIFVATGNGLWNGRTDWGDAVIVLARDAASMVGNYTPENTEELDARDLDLGSTSPALLGGGLIAQGGKAGRIHLLAMNDIRGTEPHRGGALQSVPTPSGTDLVTALAVLHAGGATRIFAADNGGTAAWLLRDRSLERQWRNGNAGTSPVVAGGLLYVYDPGGGLRVYRPETGEQVGELACGPGHWNSPIVVDGRIALPEGNANHHRTTGILNIWRAPRR